MNADSDTIISLRSIDGVDENTSPSLVACARVDDDDNEQSFSSFHNEQQDGMMHYKTNHDDSRNGLLYNQRDNQSNKAIRGDGDRKPSPKVSKTDALSLAMWDPFPDDTAKKLAKVPVAFATPITTENENNFASGSEANTATQEQSNSNNNANIHSNTVQHSIEKIGQNFDGRGGTVQYIRHDNYYDSNGNVINIETTTSDRNEQPAIDDKAKKKLHVYYGLLGIIAIIIIVVAAVAISVFASGNNNNNNGNSNNAVSQTIASPTPLSPSAAPTILYISKNVFQTRNELDDAIAEFLENNAVIMQNNITSSININVSLLKNKELFDKYGTFEAWNVSLISNFTSLFDGQRYPYVIDYFTKVDLSKWDVSSALTMNYMFRNARKFISDLSMWNVSRCTSMESLFEGAWSFDSNLSYWDTSSVVNMKTMFSDAISFKGNGLEFWNVTRVTDLDRMFAGAKIFNANLSLWNTKNVQTMQALFYYSSSFEGKGIDQWMQSPNPKMNSTYNMFAYAKSFDADLSLWNTSMIYDMGKMFDNASSFRGVGLEMWDVRKVSTLDTMFRSPSSFDGNLSSWNVANVDQMQFLFDHASNFTGKGLNQWILRRVVFMRGMFRKTLVSNVNFSGWDVSSCTSMSQMFQGAQLFQGIGLSNWRTVSVTDMEEMFDNAKSFDADLSNWDVSIVTLMPKMFSQTNAFQGIGLDRWNVSSLKNVDNMFCRAAGLKIGSNNLTSWVASLDNASLDDAFKC